MIETSINLLDLKPPQSPKGEVEAYVWVENIQPFLEIFVPIEYFNLLNSLNLLNLLNISNLINIKNLSNLFSLFYDLAIHLGEICGFKN
jgi:hypothetical protein